MTVSTMPTRQTMPMNWGLVLLQAIILLVVGLSLVISPGMTTVVLVAFLGAYWLVSGVVALARLFTHEGRSHWGWNLAGGILGIIAGLVVLRHPLYAGALVPTLLVVLLGINALIMGVVNIVRAFTGDGLTAGLLGAIDIVLGILLLGSPLIAATFVPVVVGIFALIGGIALLPMAFSARREAKAMEQPAARRAA